MYKMRRARTLTQAATVWYVLAAVLSTVLLFIIGFNIGASREKENQLRNLSEVDICITCPMCGEDTARLKSINGDYYIECDIWNNAGGCGLTTGYYNNKQKLVDDWNELCKKVEDQ